MTKPEPVERIEMPSKEIFEREYMEKKKPVVIKNLFEGQPVSEITTLEEMREKIGTAVMSFQDEYITGFMQHLEQQLNSDEGINAIPGERVLMKITDYLDFLAANPKTKRKCLENTSPPELQALFEVPEICRTTTQDHMLDNLTQLFIANEGNPTHLHFDGDHRHVILHQLAGYKRYVIIPPQHSARLLPLNNQSGIFVEHMSEPEKEAFFDYMDAQVVDLAPGETLYVPPLIWHYVDYLTDSASFTIRFRRNKVGRLLSFMYQDMYVQNVGWKMVNEEEARREYQAEIEMIEAACRRTYASEMEKHHYMKRLFEELYAKICTDCMQKMYAFTNFEMLTEKIVEYDLVHNRTYKLSFYDDVNSKLAAFAAVSVTNEGDQYGRA